MMPAIVAASSSVRSFADLPEVQLRRGLDAVGAVAEVDLVAVEGEDLFLRVALLDPDRDQRLLDLALPAAIADREADLGGEQVARQLLRDRAAARRLAAARHVADQREHHPRDAQAGVLEESGPPRRGSPGAGSANVVVGDDDAPLDRELADQLAVLAEHARDGVRRVVVERADLGEVVGIGEQHAAQRAEQRRRHEQRGDAGVTSVANSDCHFNPQYNQPVSSAEAHSRCRGTNGASSSRLTAVHSDFILRA